MFVGCGCAPYKSQEVLTPTALVFLMVAGLGFFLWWPGTLINNECAIVTTDLGAVVGFS